MDDHQAAIDALQDLQRRRLEGIATELAAGLADGEACPVCGSAEHPAPASADAADPVTADAVEEAARQVAATADRRQEAEARHAELAVEQAGVAAVAGDAATDELTAALGAARAERERAEKLATAVGPRADALRRAEQHHVVLTERQQAAVTARADVEAEHRRTTERRDALAAEIAQAIGRAADLGDRRQQVATLTSAVGAALEAERALTEATTELAGARAETRAAVAEAGVDDLADALAARDDEAAIAALEAGVAAHADAVARAHATLDDPAVQTAVAAGPADAAPAAAALAEADADVRAATGTVAVLRATRDELERRAGQVRAAVAALGPRADELATVASLAELAAGRSGDNALRMRLSTFVLAARLEQVAAAASQRLARMSGGRYALRHTDAEADGRKRGGLGLVVVDGWSGTERDPSTLSGGETFFASLALALGLADVVCAESGGTRIETLFIDEGFGSLDEATLSDVMDVLDDLRGGGRSVGIVSHVADLRSRITTQVEVRKGQQGSTVRQVTAA